MIQFHHPFFLLQKWCTQKQNDNKIIKNYEIFDENSFF